MIVSNKRLCIFDVQYGALKKTILFRHVRSLYAGETYRYSKCTLLITVSVEESFHVGDERGLLVRFGECQGVRAIPRHREEPLFAYRPRLLPWELRTELRTSLPPARLGIRFALPLRQLAPRHRELQTKTHTVLFLHHQYLW